MKKILLTGGSGFVGGNILPLLKARYDVVYPTRNELNLLSYSEVSSFLEREGFFAVIHSATPNPTKNSACDKRETMMENSLRMFMNFYNNRGRFEKMIYFGSGAEYDKSRDICSVEESDIHTSVPYDQYGLAKLYMNELARQSDNVYNFRLFGCYGPFDYKNKFLTHVINSCLDGREITINQECWFDYIQVSDVGNLVCHAIDHELKYHDYNICSGKRIQLSEIAQKIKDQMNSAMPIRILKEGFNKEYTGSNRRIVAETGYAFMDIDEGIKIQIQHERSKRQ